MRKPLYFALTVILTVVSALAANFFTMTFCAKTIGDLEINGYTITIPENVGEIPLTAFSSEPVSIGLVTAEFICYDIKLTVSINSEGLKLSNGDSGIPIIIYADENIYDEMLVFTDKTEDKSVEISILPDWSKVKYAGTYTGTITFDVSIIYTGNPIDEPDSLLFGASMREEDMTGLPPAGNETDETEKTGNETEETKQTEKTGTNEENGGTDETGKTPGTTETGETGKTPNTTDTNDFGKGIFEDPKDPENPEEPKNPEAPNDLEDPPKTPSDENPPEELPPADNPEPEPNPDLQPEPEPDGE